MATFPASGQTLGHYRLLEILGKGGMGVVYRARDQHLEREVALKLLPAGLVHDEATRKRFRKEALTLARLNHPNIETLHGFETVDGVDFLVMECVPGTSLATRLAGAPLRESEVLDIGIQLASALEEAHRQGVVHRDLKPGNIQITPNSQAKVLDFGLARLLPDPENTTRETMAETSSAAGTLPYLSPEQLRGSQPDHRSDLYSLGAVLYEMATGQRPHAQSTLGAVVEAILHQEPTPVRQRNPEISGETEAIIRKALDKDPNLRYQSARELKVDLQRLASGRNLSLVASSRPAPVAATRGSRVVAVLLVLTAFIALAAWFLGRRAQPPRGATGAPPARVVAVLPLEAIGGKAENEALCRGLTELFTASVAQISKRFGVQVVPASEVRREGVSTAEEARRKLGVNLVVEGSWDFTANNRVTYSLVDVQSKRNLNAAVVRGDVQNLQTMEREAVERLMAMLELELQPQDRQQLTAEAPARSDAYQYYVRGRGYLQNYQDPQSLKSAVTLFNTALELDPKFALSYAGLGEAYWRQYEENHDQKFAVKAVEVCRRAAQLGGQFAAVHATLGLVYRGTGQLEQAVVEYQRALDLDPTSDAAYRGLASSYEALGKPGEAEAAYRRAIAIRPDYWGSYSALGAFYYKASRYDEAAAQFSRVIELAPENVRGYTNLGAIYHLQGKYKEAQQQYEKSLSIQPTDRAYSNLGTLYFFQGRYGDSARMLEKAVQLNEHDARLMRNLASAYYWAPGERDKARAAFQRAASALERERKINPNDPKLMVQLADCYAMLNLPDAAVKLVRQALSRSPSDAEINYHAAQVYEQVGQRAAALQALGRAISAGYSIMEIRNDPALQQLRDDPQYQALAQSAPASSVGPRN